MENWDNPEYKNWGAKWGALMRWIFNQQYFRENLKLGPGGETGPANDMLRNTTERIGAISMGKRMFDQASALGLRRLRFTHRYTFLPTRSANLGSARAGRRSTLSTTEQKVPSRRLASLRVVEIFASRAVRT